jgi:hypothetical protein
MMGPTDFRRAASGALLTTLVAVSSGLILIDEAAACYIHSRQVSGLQVGHPLSIPVSLSTREAIIAGDLLDIPRATEQQRLSSLRELSGAVDDFALLLRDSEFTKRQDFAVFLTESGLWTGFSYSDDESWRVQQHLSGPGSSDIIIVVSDAAMVALLNGKMTVAQALRSGVLRSEQASANKKP